MDRLRVPTAGRVEFILTTPSSDVKKAALLVREVETGPDGDNDPNRPLAIVKVNGGHGETLPAIPNFKALTTKQRFEGLAKAKVTAKRKLYFSETPHDQFFITVEGQQPKLFSPNNPPAIVTPRERLRTGPSKTVLWRITNSTFISFTSSCSP